jgi:flagellar M-ring protein FliF
VSEVSKIMNQMGPGKMLTMAGVIVGLILFFVFISSRLAGPSLSLLFSDLEPSEAASVSARLQGMGVAHEMRDGGSIYADSSRVANLRMSLSNEGIGGSIVGMELFDKTDSLGTTSFVQNINFIRAVEGELQRTLIEINGIRKARIHVNMPQRQLFRSSARQASASVLLTTGGAGLTPEQVLSIRALVATAVPGLDANNITISDQRGSLLARGGDSGKQNLSSSLEEQRSAQEGKLRGNIEKTLEAIVGSGRIRAEVVIQMQMSRITTNAETYDPDGQVTEATQTKESSTQSTDGSGSGAVSVGTQLPDGGAGAGGAGGAGSSGTTTDEVVNFLNSRTVTTEVKEPGEITRISVGIVIDHKRVPDANADNGFVKQPWSQAEIDQMIAMTRAVIGFDQDRGDEISFANMEFASMEQGEDGPIPFNLFGLNKTDITSLIEVVVIGIVSILVLLLVIRPLILRIAASIPEASAVAQAQLEALVDQSSDVVAIPSPEIHGITPELAAAAASGDDNAVQALTRLRSQNAGGQEQDLSVDAKIDVAQVEGKVQDTALKKVGDIVTRHPEESAAIVRQWLYSE